MASIVSRTVMVLVNRVLGDTSVRTVFVVVSKRLLAALALIVVHSIYKG